MASDSRETGLIKSTCTKMYLRHGYAVGGSGDSAPLTALEHCLKWPAKPSTEAFARMMYRHPEIAWADIEVLVATKTHVWHLCGGSVSEIRAGAIGSGAAFALGYLDAKPGDIDGAVKAACKLDPHCAGPVRDLEPSHQ